MTRGCKVLARHWDVINYVISIQFYKYQIDFIRTKFYKPQNDQNEVMHECLQVFGGYGYMMEYPIARLYADARVQMIYGGSNEIMKELIARSLDA